MFSVFPGQYVSWIAESYGTCVFKLKKKKKSPKGFILSCSPQPCMSSSCYITWTGLFNFRHLSVSVPCYLITVQSHISLMTSDVAHLFIHLLVICIPLYNEVSVQIVCPFLNWISFTLLSCKYFLYIFHTSTSSHVCIANILPDCVFLFNIVFAKIVIFNSDEVQLFYDSHFFLCVWLRNSFPSPRSHIFLLHFLQEFYNFSFYM